MIASSRKEAKHLGLQRYFTGKPCPRNHVDFRRIANGSCVVCGARASKKWKDNNRRATKAYAKRYRAANPESHKARRIKWRLTNPDKVKAGIKKWRAANKETVRGYKTKWRIANRVEFQATVNKWKRANPIKIRSYSSVRRAKKLNAPGRYTADDVKAILVKQNNKCLCGASFKEVKYTVDHKTPLSRGGSNWPRNIQALCVPCNCSKGILTQKEWLRRLDV